MEQAIKCIVELCQREKERFMQLKPSTIMRMQEDLQVEQNGDPNSILEQFPLSFFNLLTVQQRITQEQQIKSQVNKMSLGNDEDDEILDADQCYQHFQSQSILFKKIHKWWPQVDHSTNNATTEILKKKRGRKSKSQQAQLEPPSVPSNQSVADQQTPTQPIQPQINQMESEVFQPPQQSEQQNIPPNIDQISNIQNTEPNNERKNSEPIKTEVPIPQQRPMTQQEPFILLEDSEDEMKVSQKPNAKQCDVCLNINDPYMLEINNHYNCSRCVLMNMNPLSQVLEVLCPGEIFMVKHSNMEQLKIKFKLSNQLRKHVNKNHQLQDYLLEIRCIQVNKQQGMQEITFPHSCSLSLNNRQIKLIKPLLHKSSLHKRKDDVLSIKNLHLLNEEFAFNTFTITQAYSEPTYRQDEPGYLLVKNQRNMYMFGLYVVRPRTVVEIVSEYQSQRNNIEYFIKKILDSAFSSSSDIEIDQIKISLQCQLTLQYIDVPARGKYCNHVQCFSLVNYLKLMKQSDHKRWRCLVCKQVCYDFEVDKLQQKIIEQQKAIGSQQKEIIFTKQSLEDLTQKQLSLVNSQMDFLNKLIIQEPIQEEQHEIQQVHEWVINID